jgi:two-component system, cell cycle sensor histidine kinase and response regulator CckA
MDSSEALTPDQRQKLHEAFVNLSHSTLRSPSEVDLWEECVDILCAALVADAVAALRCVPHGSSLELAAGRGLEPCNIGQPLVELDSKTHSALAVESDAPLIIEDIDVDERFDPSPVTELSGCRSCVSARISINGQIWGVFEIHWKDPKRPCQGELEFVSSVIELLGAALGRLDRDRERARMAARSAQEQERLFLLVEHAKDFIGISDLDGTVTYLNPGGRALVNLGERSATEMAVEDFLPEQEHPRLYDEILPELLRAKYWEGCVKLRDFASDELHDTEATVLLLEDPDMGVPVGFASIQRDISERLRLREQLRQSQKLEALGLLAGGVAHDFNNYLTVIMGYTELLLAQDVGDQAQQARLEKVRAVCDKAHRLADQLLTFSRRRVRQPEVVDLGSTLEGVRDMLRTLVGESVELDVQVSPRPTFIEIDPSDIEQAILNLVVNARDAIEETGMIEIVVRPAKPNEAVIVSPNADELSDAVVVEVCDTGRGIDPSMHERIFEPFFTTKSVGRGTGLGLATVHRIATEANGAIDVDSELGQGACFRLVFPSAEPPEAEPERRALKQEELAGEEVIVVVEDDPDVLDFITDVLEQRGYDTIPAADGDVAAEVLEMYSDSIDAVVCDVIVPRLSPREIRDLIERYPEIPFLMISGYAEAEPMADDGFLDGLPFLSKPMSPRELLERIRALFDN